MSKLDDARLKINEIDKKMAELFESRMEASNSIAEYKKENDLIKDSKGPSSWIKLEYVSPHPLKILLSHPCWNKSNKPYKYNMIKYEKLYINITRYNMILYLLLIM